MALAPFIIQPELTAIAIAYRNQQMIADAVLPRVMVNSETFKYTQFAQADAFTVPDTKVGRKSGVNQIDWSASETSASTRDYGLEDVIPQADIENAKAAMRFYGNQAVDPAERSTELLADLVALDREIRVGAAVFNAANYATANKTTLTGTGQWSDFANSNPVDAMLAAMDSMIIRPNTLVLGQAVWTKLRQHPKVVNAYYGNQANAGAVPREALAALLEIDTILVGQAFVNTAKRGQTASLSRVWGKNAALLHLNPNLKDPKGGLTYGFTGQWGDRIAGTIESDPNVGLRGGDRVRVGESVVELITCNDAGYYFQSAIA